jgi:glycosyltransferase involved in cell wall biosynthesis
VRSGLDVSFEKSLVDFPRLLVVTSNNFNLVTGGGITLTNLFHGWPADRIANLHEDPQPQDESVCRNFYRLTGSEIHLVWPFSMLVSESNTSSALSSGAEAEGPLVKISRAIFGDGVPRTFSMSEKLKRWLDEFRPQVIYSFLGSMAQIRVTAAVAERFHTPLAVHIMDDWPGVIYSHGLLAPFIRRTVMDEFRNLLERARVRLAICEDMCEGYRKRFGFDFMPFHNAVDVSEWRKRARTSWESASPFVVRYAGSIVQEAQRDALRDICLAVGDLRSSGSNIDMFVHAPANQRAYLSEFEATGVHLQDPPDPSSIVELFAGADLLVLPFNFDEHSAEYMRLSMPTKIPAYMASGTPILVYGPDSIAPVRYAIHEQWGYAVTSPGVRNVEDALKRLMADSPLRERYARRAMATAADRHDAPRVRAAFQAALRV